MEEQLKEAMEKQKNAMDDKIKYLKEQEKKDKEAWLKRKEELKA